MRKTKKTWQPLANAFCPTGEGGGIDPSCSPGNDAQKVTDAFGSRGWDLVEENEREGFVVLAKGDHEIRHDESGNWEYDGPGDRHDQGDGWNSLLKKIKEVEKTRDK